jgi:sialidase-1
LIYDDPPPFQVPATTVFAPDLAGVPCYRIPSIVQTKTGALLAFAETRYGSHWNQPGFCADAAAISIAHRRSTDGGKTWSDVVIHGSRDYKIDGPQAVAIGSKVILIFVIQESSKNGMIQSVDDGVTWSEPVEIDIYGSAYKEVTPGPGQMLQLALSKSHNGRLISAGNIGGAGDAVAYSDDEGKTWTGE